MDIMSLLKYAIEHHASDVHLSANMPPIVRIDGDLQKIDGQPAISNDELLTALEAIIPKKQFALLKNQFEIDFSLALPKLARFRVNIFQQMEGLAAVFRIIPFKISTLEELNLPPILKELCVLPNGIVLITGPTGCGKSTTLAAMVDYINHQWPRHILTLEDPIEFMHHSEKCLIQQREIHQHSASFNDALRAALREDPNVILVGEMRDIETIRLALTAAETGHLVFATLHTSSSAKTINRVVDVFPAGEKELVRTMLAESLQAVVAQTLLKKKGGGRVAACEILLSTPAVRNLIRENKIPQIESILQTGQSKGMRTMEQSLKELVAQGIIEKDQ